MWVCHLELRHLRYFVAVAEYGGISHAAERLNIAQPAVSRQIRDLELELGFDLLSREGRRVVLTDAGHEFARHARAILQQTEDATDAARRVAHGEAGCIRVGLLESASWAGHVPLILSRFKRRHDRIRLDIRPMSSVDQINALMAGDIDAAFVYRQDNLSEADVAVHHLRTDNVVLAASVDLVFDHDGALTFDDIDGLPFVGFPRSVAPAYFDQLFGALSDIGLQPDIIQDAVDETTMLSLVSAGVGCAFVNSANMQRPPCRVQFREVQGLSVPIDLLFVTRRARGSLTQMLVDTVATIDAIEASST